MGGIYESETERPVSHHAGGESLLRLEKFEIFSIALSPLFRMDDPPFVCSGCSRTGRERQNVVIFCDGNRKLPKTPGRYLPQKFRISRRIRKRGGTVIIFLPCNIIAEYLIFPYMLVLIGDPNPIMFRLLPELFPKYIL